MNVPAGFGTYLGVEVAELVHREFLDAKTLRARQGWASVIAPCPPVVEWGEQEHESYSKPADWRVPDRVLKEAPPGIDEGVWKQALMEGILPEGLKFRSVGAPLLDQIGSEYRGAILKAAHDAKGTVTDGFLIEALSLALSIAIALSQVSERARHSDPWTAESLRGRTWEWLLRLAPNGWVGWGIRWGGEQWAVPGGVAGGSVEFMCAIAPQDELGDLCLELAQRLSLAIAQAKRRREKDIVREAAEIGRSAMLSLAQSHEIYDGPKNRAKAGAIADAAVKLVMEGTRPGIVAEAKARAQSGRMTREMAETRAAQVNRKVTLVEDAHGVRHAVTAVGIEERTASDGAEEFGVRLSDGDVVWDSSLFVGARRGCAASLVAGTAVMVALIFARKQR